VPKTTATVPNAARRLTEAQLDSLRQLDTCILADALEKFDIRPRNQGFARSGLHCLNGDFGTVVGYAATALVKSSDPPVLGHFYFESNEFWTEIASLPEPRFAVLQDVDANPGTGACIGQVAASILQALHCAGAVTNGAVRDLSVIAAMKFPVFAAHVSPSRAYAHLIDCGQPVDIFGLHIKPGDLLVADSHGVLSIPIEIAPELPQIALDLLQRKRRFIDFCHSSEFSLDRLKDEVRQFKP
jgi:4-hydroxy-4-methyl-2-oxoglutarate aldolase